MRGGVAGRVGGDVVNLEDLLDTGARRYAPAEGRVDRVQLGWWSEAGGPLLAPLGSAFATVVVVWPTTREGRLLVEAIEEVRVLEWHLDLAAAQRLAALHVEWDLRGRDLLVRGRPGGDLQVVPGRDSVFGRLRAASDGAATGWLAMVDARVRNVAASLARGAAAARADIWDTPDMPVSLGMDATSH